MKARNHVVVALIKSRKSTFFHGKSEKAKRRADKVKIQKEI